MCHPTFIMTAPTETGSLKTNMSLYRPFPTVTGPEMFNDAMTD